jgi:DNA end-binding protein Ku
MARAIWQGSLSFGLVNIPVSLHAAEISDELHFHLLDRRDKAPIHNQRINSKTGDEVPWEQIERGYEFEPGRYVVLSDADFQHANPESTETIEILEFVERAAIEPSYFDKPYYLAPRKGGAKSYALLRQTLARSDKVGIAKVVLRTRQHLAAVLAVDRAIVVNLMRFADELRDAEGLDLPTASQKVGDKELKLAQQLVEAMVEPWDPSRYRDDYRVDVKALIDRRIKAGELDAGHDKAPRRRSAGGKVVDLMALLKKSVDAGGQRGQRGHPGKGEKRDALPAAAKAAGRASKAVAKKPGKRTPTARPTGSSRRSSRTRRSA